MCNRMPQKLSGIATRMKNMNPIITDFPNVEVTADNQVALDQLEQIKGSIIATLKTYLHNKSITLSLCLADKEEVAPILSRREQYEQMEKENPSIAKLRELLNLELA
jgi:DNA polymerase-3 subunit gamma/tau